MTALLEEIVRIYDEQFGNMKVSRHVRLTEWRGFSTHDTDGRFINPPSLTRIKTVDAFRELGTRATTRRGEKQQRRRRRRDRSVCQTRTDEIESHIPDAAIRLNAQTRRTWCNHFRFEFEFESGRSLVNDSPFEWMVTMSDFRNVFGQLERLRYTKEDNPARLSSMYVFRLNILLVLRRST